MPPDPSPQFGKSSKTLLIILGCVVGAAALTATLCLTLC